MTALRVSSREAVLDAALRIADNEGLESVTMRRVATELALPVTTLYGFVRTKNEILEGLGALALADLCTGHSSDQPWDTHLAGLIRDLRATLASHPGVVELILNHPQANSSFDHVREAILGALRPAGLGRQETLEAMGALINYALGFAVAEGRRARFPNHAAAEPARLRRLHPLDYPNLTELAEDYHNHQSGNAFETGLQSLLRGLTPHTRPSPD